MRIRLTGLAAWLAVAAFGALALATPSRAAFPVARNGRIVYTIYTGGAEGVALINSDGSNHISVTNGLGGSSPEFSPNGRWIAISGIWLVREADGSQLPLTHGYDLDPSFSPDERTIVFSRETSDSGSDLVLADFPGPGQIQLTNTPGPQRGEYVPTFSPDGKTIFYSRCESVVSLGTLPFDCHIWRMNRDGSGQAQLTTAGRYDYSPEVSPDGMKLAYERCSESGYGYIGQCQIVIRDLKTNAETALDPTPGSEFAASFSPDGKKLAIDASGPIADSILVSNLDGSDATQITNPASAGARTPEWEYIYTCGGRRATIFGTDSGEQIDGTKKSDVIVANGGDDKVKGHGGNDRICGGRGRDRLIGGGSSGKGDLCIGGQGRDKGKGCEKGKL